VKLAQLMQKVNLKENECRHYCGYASVVVDGFISRICDGWDVPASLGLEGR
jgi:hypothetical protein